MFSRIFLFFTTIMVLGLGCAKKGMLKVGVILPMTGTEAKFGEMEANAFRMAVEEINAKGGVKGKKIQLLIEDDTGKPEIARSVAEKLITRDKVLVIGGGYSSSCSYAIAGVAERFGVPFVINTGAADTITKQGWQYIFRINPPVSEYPKGMMDFWEQVVHPKSMAILFENTLFGTSGAKTIKKYCEQKGIKVTDYESYEAGAVDFKPMLVKVKSHHPDIVYMISYIMDASLLMRQSKELDFNPKLFCGGAAGFTMPAFIENAGDAAEYVVSATLWSPKLKYPGANEFYEKYSKQFGISPDYHAVEAYAGLYVIVDALKRARALNPEDIKNALDTTNMMTPFGPVKFDNYNGFTHQNNLPTLVVQIINGKFETIWPREYASHAYIYPIKPWRERQLPQRLE